MFVAWRGAGRALNFHALLFWWTHFSTYREVVQFREHIKMKSSHSQTHTHASWQSSFRVSGTLVLWDIWLSATCLCPSLLLASAQSPPGCTIPLCATVSPTSWHCSSVFTPALLCPDVAFLLDASLNRTHSKAQQYCIWAQRRLHHFHTLSDFLSLRIHRGRQLPLTFKGIHLCPCLSLQIHYSAFIKAA